MRAEPNESEQNPQPPPPNLLPLGPAQDSTEISLGFSGRLRVSLCSSPRRIPFFHTFIFLVHPFIHSFVLRREWLVSWMTFLVLCHFMYVSLPLYPWVAQFPITTRVLIPKGSLSCLGWKGFVRLNIVFGSLPCPLKSLEPQGIGVGPQLAEYL